jgi:monoamine oxidase
VPVKFCRAIDGVHDQGLDAYAPELAGLRRDTDLDVLIVGAGAAGIAAGRRLLASNRKFAIIEATDRVGGRCFTDTALFNLPYDRGAN